LITHNKDVRLAGAVVAQVVVPEYETVDELIAAEEDSRILGCFNAGNKVRIMSNERAKFGDKPLSKQAKLMAGMAALTIEELQEVAGNSEKMKDMALSNTVQARVEEARKLASNDAPEAVDVEEDAEAAEETVENVSTRA